VGGRIENCIFQPGHPSVTVVRPGEFALHVRDLLARLDVAGGKGEERGEGE
jgi:hypothetical protein